MTADERITRLRSKVQEEKDLTSTLRSALIDREVKELLCRPALEYLDFIEGFFLDPKVLRETRTPTAMAKWLGYAERELQRAIELRLDGEDVLKKYGPAVKLTSGARHVG